MTGVSSKYLRGVTLIELLVSISVFSIFITVDSQLLASALQYHQQALEKVELLSQISYGLDFMDRSLRMAQKDYNGRCITQNFNYENYNGSSTVRFIDYQGKCCEFSSQDVSQDGKTFKVLMVRKSSTDAATQLGDYLALTPIGLSVNSLVFSLNGQGQLDDLQPSVSIALKIRGRLTPPLETKIQTTISKRELDVPY
ncbi:MAG: prepilin-type N-terminal cleavage/methylation domain-containing protein [Candidatus Gribaldobacteria bacterium]|nr:prepilin-type N-terminal cleavage/methylation domain-containing protein [Candidatus Gribaldobacteria bacterium]